VEINRDRIVEGRNFAAHEIERGRPVALITPRAVDDLFGAGGSAVGRNLRIGEQRFTVIGVLDTKERDVLTSFGVRDDNNRTVIPFTTYQGLLGMREIPMLQIEAVSPDEAQRALEQVVELLSLRHDHRYAYAGEVMAGHATTADRILGAITLVGATSALLSLVVGGIGIMNIMSMSVTERTVEIGVRKAVGAPYHDIHRQFLLEAVLISAAGGLLGLALGISGALALTWSTGFPLQLSWLGASVAFCCAIVVGVLSGLLPARRAALLEPVRALGYE
jgi:putative ABC transport system permease protein